MQNIDYNFRQDYWADEQARSAFMKFLDTIHGLDLTAWLESGYWDDEDYHPFSFFDETGKVVASTCLFTMDLVIAGKTYRAGQLSGVGTLADYRRRGLNRELTRRALEWARPDHELIFLFSSDEARPFYRACGFRPFTEQEPFLPLKGTAPRAGAQRLDLGKKRDRTLIEELAFGRCASSNILAAHNPRVFLFHTIYQFADALISIPELGVVAIAAQEGARLRIIDVVGKRMPSLSSLLPFLIKEETEEVVFGFVPDLLEPRGLQWRPLDVDDCFVLGNIELPSEPVLFSATARA